VTAADIHGPWVDPKWESGLVARVRKYWDVPIPELPDAALAVFLRQQIAVEPTMEEAQRRLAAGQTDQSEIYDGELAAAVEDTTDRSHIVVARRLRRLTKRCT
jgi:hypothetical protein